MKDTYLANLLGFGLGVATVLSVWGVAILVGWRPTL